MTGLEQISPPALEPLSLDEVKLSLRIDAAEDDALLDRLITVARQRCEQFTGRVLIAQSWRLSLDRWPGSVVELPVPPLLAVNAVRVIAADDSAVVLNSSGYSVDAASVPGRLIRRGEVAWPAPGRAYNGIEIEYDAGYGPNWNDVPEALRQGMLLLIGHLYETREGEGAALPASVLALWNAFRQVRL